MNLSIAGFKCKIVQASYHCIVVMMIVEGKLLMFVRLTVLNDFAFCLVACSIRKRTIRNRRDGNKNSIDKRC